MRKSWYLKISGGRRRKNGRAKHTTDTLEALYDFVGFLIIFASAGFGSSGFYVQETE
jgi:hypothetical protein